MDEYTIAYNFAIDFVDKHGIEMNTLQMTRFIDALMAFRKAAQQSVQADGGMRCAVCGRDQIEGVGCPDILCESHRR